MVTYKNRHRLYIVLSIIILSLVCLANDGGASNEIEIVVKSTKGMGTIPKYIFGTNMIAYNPSMSEGWGENFFGHSNYGAGVWNPKLMKPVPEAMSLAKDIKITALRFPGGDGSWFYNWKNTIGEAAKRPHFLYGLDEFMRTCEEIGAQAVITLPYYIMNENDAADLVEYLNGVNNGRNRKGGIDWAKERAKNGHPRPYKVKYFELGNEVFYGVKQKGIAPVAPIVYAKDYIRYRTAMKAVDPSIMLGAVTVNSGSSGGISLWNERLFKTAGKNIDFLIEHTYRPGYSRNDFNVDTKQLFTYTLNSLDEVDSYYRSLSKQFTDTTGRILVPIAVTEYNAGFVQDSPVPFRHSLGAALFNAGLLQIFMKPENNIFMANYWQYANSYWGMIKNDKFIDGRGHFIKRPNYYVFEMFSKHFASNLISVSVSKNKDSFEKQAVNNLLKSKSWTVEKVRGVESKIVNDTVELLFNGSDDINYYHAKKSVGVRPNTIYRVTGYLRTENLNDLEGVCLTVEDGRGWSATKSSVTSRRVWGTTDWIRVSVDYLTLPDAKSLSVVIRRISGKGRISGHFFVKDIRVSEQDDMTLDNSQKLSVIASKSDDGRKLYVMVLNKNVNSPVRSTIKLKGTSSAGNAEVYILNGPDIAASNEQDSNSVVISHKTLPVINGSKLNLVFPAHSLTAIEFNK